MEADSNRKDSFVLLLVYYPQSGKNHLSNHFYSCSHRLTSTLSISLSLSRIVYLIPPSVSSDPGSMHRAHYPTTLIQFWLLVLPPLLRLLLQISLSLYFFLVVVFVDCSLSSLLRMHKRAHTHTLTLNERALYSLVAS